MGSALKLAESTVTLIESYIKTNIASALADVRTDRSDPQVTTEAPDHNSYFRFEMARAFRAPAIFTIIEDMNFNSPGGRTANHINATCRLIVAAVVEDRDKTRLTTKTWRYQAALMKLLEQTSLTSLDNKVKLFVRVSNASFSAVVSTLRDEKAPEAVFRKEVALNLEVEHVENF